jgi:hypothetical protein
MCYRENLGLQVQVELQVCLEIGLVLSSIIALCMACLYQFVKGLTGEAGSTGLSGSQGSAVNNADG